MQLNEVLKRYNYVYHVCPSKYDNRIMKNGLVPKDRIGKSYYYDFGDGWCACIDVIKMNANSNEYRQMKRNNRGFCGYNWMVDLIISNNEIKLKEDEK